LSFNTSTTSKGALDAVSCASMFSSDKGRFITDADVSAGYHEPWQEGSDPTGMKMPLPLTSLYPPRMDVMRCAASGSCFDHADVSMYVDHARSVMPEIDAVTMATPPGESAQSILITLPTAWPKGNYVAWLEINVEGDYNATYDDKSYPTANQPSTEWDSWSQNYGYAYRGQPSLAFAVPFSLGDMGEADYSTDAPKGQSSWDTWAGGYGQLEALSSITDDPMTAPGSGADRLHRDASGARLTLHVQTLAALPDADPNVPLPSLNGTTMSRDSGTSSSGSDSSSSSSSGSGADAGPAALAGMGMSAGKAHGSTTPSTNDKAPASQPPPAQTDPVSGAMILVAPGLDTSTNPVGTVRELRLQHSQNKLHSHEWISISFRAVESEQALHSYDVRVATQPIVDELSFILEGRPAKTATLDREGAVELMLPADVPAGGEVQGAIGDLVPQTHYYVAVRATDALNRHGPISVAEITTTKREFATVSPCFVATAAYGTPLASEVGALRRVRDQQLLTNAAGRAFVRAYYARGAALADALREHESWRSVVRSVLSPLVSLSRLITD
jgi:hypothetical protein